MAQVPEAYRSSVMAKVHIAKATLKKARASVGKSAGVRVLQAVQHDGNLQWLFALSVPFLLLVAFGADVHDPSITSVAISSGLTCMIGAGLGHTARNLETGVVRALVSLMFLMAFLIME